MFLDYLQRITKSIIPDGETFRLYIATEFESKNEQLNKIVLGRIIPECVANWQDATLIFIGLPSSPLLSIWLMTFTQFTHVLHYFPNEKKIVSIE